MALKLTKIQLPDGPEIWVQYDDEADVPEEGGPRGISALDAKEKAKKLMDDTLNTIQGYSRLLLDAIEKGMEDFTPDEVTLEFGVQFGGEAGIPFVAKGTAQANAKVSVQWDLKGRKDKPA